MADMTNRTADAMQGKAGETKIMLGATTYTRRYANLLPPLSAEERADLREDVQRRGVLVPVGVDDDNNVINGIHRLEIAAEIGLAEVPVRVEAKLTEEENLAWRLP